MTFTRTIENFVCEHCGYAVTGDGHTNHCPHCLWSKHIDVDPGDRREKCGGMMRPVALEGSSPLYVIVHRCERCGSQRRNKVQREDDAAAVLALADDLGM